MTTVESPAGHLAEARLPVLDGIRGVAILMILAFHYHQGMLPLSGTWFKIPSRLLNVGQTGVDLFFVLSGFLITGILLNAKGSPHFLRNFYMRRVLRILPLYYLVVLAGLVGGWISSNFEQSFAQTWWYLFYLQNIGTTFWPQLVGGPGHFWSLGVEEHFYMFWPFLILVCNEQRMSVVLFSLIGGAMACRFLLLTLGYSVFTFSFCRMDALAAGALLAVLVRRPELAQATLKTCRWILIMFGPFLLLLYPFTSGKALFAMQMIKYPLTAMAYTALLGVVVGPGRWIWLERFFCIRGLRWCGKYSYAMYVFHPFVYGFIMSLMRTDWRPLATTNPGLYMSIEFSICIATVFFVSWLSWHLFEKHFLKLKKLFDYQIKVSESPTKA